MQEQPYRDPLDQADGEGSGKSETTVTSLAEHRTKRSPIAIKPEVNHKIDEALEILKSQSKYGKVLKSDFIETVLARECDKIITAGSKHLKPTGTD